MPSVLVQSRNHGKLPRETDCPRKANGRRARTSILDGSPCHKQGKRGTTDALSSASFSE